MPVQPSRILWPALVVWLAGCANDRSGAPNAVFFVDHVDRSEPTLVRADLPGVRSSSAIAAPVTLRGETRRSLALPNGVAQSFPVEVPENGVLRFAIAAATLTAPAFRTPAGFRVTLQTGNDEETLFAESIRRADRNRWHDRELDLSTWAGMSGRLTFEAFVPPEDEREIFPLWANPVLAPAVPAEPTQTLILISVDCLRADHVGAYGYDRDTTPRIDAFAEDGVVFETAIATSATTLPTHMSMFTGFTPSEHGASNRHMLSRSVPFLPELLRDAGFLVDGVVSGAYLAQNFGFERGFHTYRSLQRPRAVETIDAALDVLDRAEGLPHFLFLHLIDAHWPYQPPREREETFGPIQTDVPRMLEKVLKQIPPDGDAEIQQAIDLYDAEIAYADHELGRFFDELVARELYDEAFIIVTADHGEAFYEHDNWQHGWTLYDEIVHVPLIIKWPDSARPDHPARIDTLVSQVDLFATLLAQAGVPPPHGRSTDLSRPLDDSPRRFAVSEFTSNPAPGELPVKHVSFRTRGAKYIATFRTDGDDELSIVERIQEELYDLDRDAGETADRAADAADEIEGFRRGLKAYLDDARAFRDWRHGDEVIEDDAIRDRLRALGYIQ